LYVVLDDRARSDARAGVRALILGTLLHASAGQNIFPQFPPMVRIKVAHNREACIVRRVVELEEISHVLELGRLDVCMRTDDFTVVGMLFREEVVKEAFFDDAVRSVFPGSPRSLRTTSC